MQSALDSTEFDGRENPLMAATWESIELFSRVADARDHSSDDDTT